jgi:hypothetical protein
MASAALMQPILPTLFSPIERAGARPSHRVVMAALTCSRSRATLGSFACAGRQPDGPVVNAAERVGKVGRAGDGPGLSLAARTKDRFRRVQFGDQREFSGGKHHHCACAVAGRKRVGHRYSSAVLGLAFGSRKRAQ